MHLPSHARPEDHNGSLVTDGLRREITSALHEWRRNRMRGSQLADPVDPELDHVRGDPVAPVVVVEYGELGSPAESKDDRTVAAQLRGLLEEGKVFFAPGPLLGPSPRADEGPDLTVGQGARHACRPA